jgi:LysM domain-containing protein
LRLLSGALVDQGMPSVPSTYPEKPSPNLAPRVFAVLALILAGVAAALLIAGGLDSSSSPSTPTSAATQAASGPKHPYYVVQAGDSFSSIAQKEGVSQGRIEKLNPNLDPSGLQPQNCVDLIPHGCRKLAAQSGSG